MMFGTAVAIIAAALLISALMLVTASVAGIDVATAKAAKCAWANRGPRHVSQRRARQAVICEINKKRKQPRAATRPREVRAPQGGEAPLEVHEAPRLLRAPVPWGEGPRGQDPRHQLSPLQLQLARG